MFFDGVLKPSDGSWNENYEFGVAKNISSPLGL